MNDKPSSQTRCGRAAAGWGYFISIVLVLILSGCTKLGPDFTKPAAPVAGQWLDTADETVKFESADHQQWWKVFQDPVLDDLVDRAARQNLPLQISGIRILEARAQVGVAVGRWYPQLQQARGGLGHVELSENSPNASPLIDGSFRDTDIGFDAAWELDFWGRFRRGIEAADASLLSEIANYDDILVSLTAEVAKTYVVIRTFEERIKLARGNVAIQERSLQIAQVRFDNGLTTELDVEEAKTLLTNTQALIPQLQIGLRQAQHALSILLGIPPTDLRDMIGTESAIPTAPADIAVGIPADLLRRRPDIRRAELQAAAQSALIGVAESDLYPHFSLTGSVGLRSSDTGKSDLSDLFDGDSIEAGFGPSFSWNILNYGRIKNAVRVEDARFQQAVVNYQNTVLNAAREVEDSLVAFILGKQRVRHLQDSETAARRSVDLALIQYRDGAAAYTRVLDTQEFLVTQQDAHTAARGDVVRSIIGTYKALGGGWQTRQGLPFVPESVEQEMGTRTDWGKLLDSDPAPPEADGLRKPDW